MFCSFLQGGGVYVYYSTVTMTSCSITGNTASGSVRAHAQNFPSPSWETHILLVICREAVSLSKKAQCLKAVQKAVSQVNTLHMKGHCQSLTPKCIPIKLPSCVLMLKIHNAFMW